MAGRPNLARMGAGTSSMATLTRTLVISAICLALLAVPAAAQRLAFDPSVSVPTAVNFTVDLTLDSQGATVQGLDVVFTYDPMVVQFTGVTAGDWFTASGLDHYLWLDPATALDTVHFVSNVLGHSRVERGLLVG